MIWEERYTDRLRHALRLAGWVGHGRHASEVSPLDLLWGVAHARGGVGHDALAPLTGSLLASAPPLPGPLPCVDGEEVADSGVPLGEVARQVLELAALAAWVQGVGFVGTEHLVLQLLRGPAGEVPALLRSAGASPERHWSEVQRLYEEGARLCPLAHPEPNLAPMDEESREPIYFYSKTNAYYELSNFSPHGFSLDGAYWPTVEHYFQAQKFPSQPAHQEKIRQARSPKEAKALGRSRKVPLRQDWEEAKDEVMRQALRAKFTTHADLAELLRGTRERELIENAPSDYYWGCGRTGTGKNRLGVLLMELRAALQAGA